MVPGRVIASNMEARRSGFRAEGGHYDERLPSPSRLRIRRSGRHGTAAIPCGGWHRKWFAANVTYSASIAGTGDKPALSIPSTPFQPRPGLSRLLPAAGGPIPRDECAPRSFNPYSHVGFDEAIVSTGRGFGAASSFGSSKCPHWLRVVRDLSQSIAPKRNHLTVDLTVNATGHRRTLVVSSGYTCRRQLSGSEKAAYRVCHEVRSTGKAGNQGKTGNNSPRRR